MSIYDKRVSFLSFQHKTLYSQHTEGCLSKPAGLILTERMTWSQFRVSQGMLIAGSEYTASAFPFSSQIPKAVN